MSADLPLEEVYLFLLERTSRRFKKHAKKALEAVGVSLSSDQWVVIKRIHEEPGSTQRDIATSTYKDPASITRILDLLQKQGFVKRLQETDRRSFGIYLTPKGEETVQLVLPTAVAVRAKGLEGFSNQEKEQLKQFLKRLHHNFDE